MESLRHYNRSCSEIIKTTGLGEKVVKAWIKNNLYRHSRKGMSKIASLPRAINDSEQKYKLSEVGEIIMNNIEENVTVETTSGSGDIFDLLGVTRRSKSVVVAPAAITGGSYGPLLEAATKRRDELDAVILKIKTVMSLQVEIEKEQANYLALLGVNQQPLAPTINKHVKKASFKKEGEVIMDLLAAGEKTYAQLVEATGFRSAQINSWIGRQLSKGTILRSPYWRGAKKQYTYSASASAANK
jgi:hypothetical protein